jgi:5-oxoprolinase (ATP-hydrolysing)
MLENLYEEVVEIEERVLVDREDCQLPSELKSSWRKDGTLNNESVLISKELNVSHAKEELVALRAKGIKSLAILLLHSYS